MARAELYRPDMAIREPETENQNIESQDAKNPDTENRDAEDIRALKKKLLVEKKNGYDRLDESEISRMHAYCEGYKAFLNGGRTERLCTRLIIKLAEEQSYRVYTRGMALHPGDKVYWVNRNKSVFLAHIGHQALAGGVQIAAAHIDSPRLDLKPNPLYEENELAYFKTHYYGGLKKYQWTCLPLELHGVVIRRDGEVVEVNIGADPGEPKLVITDLLPHLGMEQSKKPLGTAIPGETLNLLLGSQPVRGKGSERVKLKIIQILYEKYGITESDFTSAELEAVPALPACDVGIDRSLIGSYGQDDRVCAYAVFKALLDLPETPERTAVCVLVDKEEIGSDGVTGMQSTAFDRFMQDLCDSEAKACNAAKSDSETEPGTETSRTEQDYTDKGTPVQICLENSFCLSADVTAAYDPNFSEVYDKCNASYINYGMGICKYTGSRGKSGASDASAEAVAYARNILDQANVLWQISELGKVDAGGGGTVALFMANRNITTLDAGVPLLSMHSPFEIVSKLDCYETYRGMQAIYLSRK